MACYQTTPPPAPPPAQNAPVASTPEVRDLRAAIGDPVGFLPMDSELVLAIDGEQLRRSPLWDLVEPRIRTSAGSDLLTFTRVCGFDPIDSIRGLTVGLRGLKQDAPEGVLVLTGLSRTKLGDCLERAVSNATGTLSVDRGVYTIKKTPTDRTSMAFSFVDEATVVLLLGASADRAALEKVIAAGTPLRRSPTFTQLFAQVDTSASVWGIVNGRSSIFDLTQGNQKPTAMWGWVHLDSGASVSLRLRFNDPSVPQQMTAQLQGQLSTAQMFFDRLDVTPDGPELVVAAEMSESKLATLLSLMGLAQKAVPPPPASTTTTGP